MEIVIVIVNIQSKTKNMNVDGPFEGFFVSSVDFCKNVKFDNKDDSKRDNIRTGININQSLHCNW